ncbi:MAG: type II secretion system F family protein [Isosphaeraceae bacterium]
MSDDPQRPRRRRSSASGGDPERGSDGEPNVFRPSRPTSGEDRKPGGRSAKETRGPGEGPSFWERIVYGSIGSGQLSTFCRQLAAYLNAGVAYQQALASLQLQFSRTALGPVIGRLQQAVKRGDDLSSAVAREPQAFDPLFLSMIRVAEERGGIPETLRLLARHYEARLRLLRQARSAMIYPIAVLLVASLVVALLTIWLRLHVRQHAP